MVLTGRKYFELHKTYRKVFEAWWSWSAHGGWAEALSAAKMFRALLTKLTTPNARPTFSQDGMGQKTQTKSLKSGVDFDNSNFNLFVK